MSNNKTIALPQPSPEGRMNSIKAAFAEGDAVMVELEMWHNWRMKQKPISPEYKLARRMHDILEAEARRFYCSAMELVNEALDDPDTYIPCVQYMVEER